MDSEKVEKISNILNEEKWTRAVMNNYSVANFREFDSYIDNIDDETKDEILRITDEHLDKSRNSIIALYISGIITLSKHMLDDSNMLQLISMFQDIEKWNVVEFLCDRMLQFGENKLVLKALANCYHNENEEDKKVAVWERLIRVDFDETDIVKSLAEKYESEGNKEKAINYYKKAIHRYANKKLFANVKDIWAKLLEYTPEDFEFFCHFLKKFNKTMTPDKEVQLMEALYQSCKKEGKWDQAIGILKQIVELDPKNADARTEIIFCYRQKYSSHSQLEEFIAVSNLSQTWKNLPDAINDFEKHISFDAGNFVFHKTWGIGKIAELKGENIIIDFITKKNHSMSIKMAVNALTILDKEHIRVIKCTHKKSELRKKIKEDISWTLKTIIQSLNNEADLKLVKLELVPSILTPGEWTAWSTEAKKVLKTDPQFGPIAEKEGFYEVRQNPISYEEKALDRFKSESLFFHKLKTVEEFLTEETAVDSEYLPEMLGYFRSFLKPVSCADEKVISSYIFLKKLAAQHSHLDDKSISITFTELFRMITDLESTFGKILDTEIKREFLDAVKEDSDIPEWADIFCSLFPSYLSSYIPDTLVKNGFTDKVKAVFKTILDEYKDKNFKEAYVWLIKNGDNYACYKDMKPAEKKILTQMLHLLDITFRDINGKRNLNTSRKINRQIQLYLFKENRLENFMLRAGEKEAQNMYTLLAGVDSLDPNMKLDIQKKLRKKYPDIKFAGDKAIEVVSKDNSLTLVTAAGMAKKQKELKYILDVEIPKNSAEIGAAIQLGDLSENYEYKSGKEKQEMLNITVAKLQEEINNAQVFNPENLKLDKISFGTKVTLLNLNSKKEETYTILGPWESSPEDNIISYIAPFSAELLGAEKNEEIHFSINGTAYNFKVISIEKSELI